MTVFSVNVSSVYSHMVSYCPAASLLSVLAVSWNDLSFLLSPCTTPSLCPISPSFASVLFSRLSFYFCSYLLLYFFMGSQWREDGGPGFGHWCGRARWLCQYPWPAGNSSGSTTSQSGAPSWEEVPDNVWERLLCVWENGVQMKGREEYDIRKTRDDFRIELEESSFVLQCFRWVIALKCIVPRTCTWNSTQSSTLCYRNKNESWLWNQM